MEKKSHKFVLIPIHEFRLLTSKRKITKNGKISGTVKQVELSESEDETEVPQNNKRFIDCCLFYFYFILRPRKQSDSIPNKKSTKGKSRKSVKQPKETFENKSSKDQKSQTEEDSELSSTSEASNETDGSDGSNEESG